MTPLISLSSFCVRHAAQSCGMTRGLFHTTTPRPLARTNSVRQFSSQKKRRRRALKNQELTKKDRMRLRKKRPEKSFTGIFVSSDKLGDVLESRVLQARKALYNFWTFDGQSSGGRPERVGPTMDGRWWFWNICLALMPATIIGLYCEFVAEPEMQAFFKELNEQEQRRLMAEDFLEDEDNNMQHQQDNSLDTVVQTQGFGQKTAEAIREIRSLSAEAGGKAGADEQTKDQTNLAKGRSQESKHVVSDSDGNMNKSRPDQKDETTVSEKEMLVALHHRIDALQAELEKQKRVEDRQKRYRLERAQQSGIQNRIEDRKIQEWQDQKEKQVQTTTETQDSDDDGTRTEKTKEAAWLGLRKHLNDRMEAVERYGIDIMDRAWGFAGETKDAAEAQEENGSTTSDSDKPKEVTEAPLYDPGEKSIRREAEGTTVGTSESVTESNEAASSKPWWRFFQRKEKRTDRSDEDCQVEPSH